MIALLCLVLPACDYVWKHSETVIVNTANFASCGRKAVASVGVIARKPDEEIISGKNFLMFLIPVAGASMNAKIILMQPNMVEVAIYGPNEESKEMRANVQPVIDRLVVAVRSACGSPA